MSPAGLPERVRRARVLRELSTRGLDRLANISIGETSRIENEKRPNVGGETIAKIANALKVSHDWLWNGPDTSVVVRERKPRQSRDTLRATYAAATDGELVTHAKCAGVTLARHGDGRINRFCTIERLVDVVAPLPELWP